MRKVFLNVTALALTFLIGLSVQIIRPVGQPPESVAPAVSAEQVSADKWHRLYEAAAMTGDSGLFHGVHSRLLCVNNAGLATASPVEQNASAWDRRIKGDMFCRDRNGTLHELNANREYGAFARRIVGTHASWGIRNLAFVRSVGSPQMARAYVYDHLPPSDK